MSHVSSTTQMRRAQVTGPLTLLKAEPFVEYVIGTSGLYI